MTTRNGRVQVGNNKEDGHKRVESREQNGAKDYRAKLRLEPTRMELGSLGPKGFGPNGEEPEATIKGLSGLSGLSDLSVDMKELK
jgi:hypothetical protein